MSSVFADSFAHYSISQIVRKWTYGSALNASLVGGRDGRTGISIVSGLLAKTVPHQPSYVSGVAMNYSQTPGGTIMVHSHVNMPVIRLNLLSDGTLDVVFGMTGEIIDNSNKSLHSGIFNYIELKTALSGGKGDAVTAAVKIKVNGDIWIDNTKTSVSVGINNLTLQRASINGVQLGCAQNIGGTIYNDFYIVNTQGINNDFVGDVIIGSVYADGDDTNQFDPALPHFSLINEHIADDDSSTVHSNSAGQYELYTWEDIATFEGTIPFVHYGICARKDKEGLRSLIPIVGGPGTEVNGENFLNQNYEYYFVAMDTDPTAGTWTVNGFNNQKFGFKIKT